MNLPRVAPQDRPWAVLFLVCLVLIVLSVRVIVAGAVGVGLDPAAPTQTPDGAHQFGASPTGLPLPTHPRPHPTTRPGTPARTFPTTRPTPARAYPTTRPSPSRVFPTRPTHPTPTSAGPTTPPVVTTPPVAPGSGSPQPLSPTPSLTT